MKKIILLFVIILFITSCNGQEKTMYKIGTIPNIEKFEKLTEYEKELDEKKDKYNAEKLKMIQENNIFRDDVPEKVKQQNIDYETTILQQKYTDNRSRYFLTSYKNETSEKNTFSNEEEPLTTECDCYLDSDTIKIKMGIWVFGGFGFPLTITKTDFKAEYWEDMHKRPVYKKQISDTTTTESIEIGFENIELILAKRPAFSIGESIMGYMRLKTQNYYESEDEYSDKYDRKHLKGEIYFKCKIRKKTFADE